MYVAFLANQKYSGFSDYSSIYLVLMHSVTSIFITYYVPNLDLLYGIRARYIGVENALLPFLYGAIIVYMQSFATGNLAKIILCDVVM